MDNRFIKITKRDNVAVAVENLDGGTAICVDGVSITLVEALGAGHKFALDDIGEGEVIYKYGFPIGVARCAIKKGEKVDHLKIKTALTDEANYSYTKSEENKNVVSLTQRSSFDGFLRENGDVGVRNDLVVLPTVGCVNGIVKRLASEFRVEHPQIQPLAYTHNYGCSQLGEDHEACRRILRDIVLHPNVGGVLVVGLGCENNQVSQFRELLGDVDEERVKFLICQEVDDEMEEGLRLMSEICSVMLRDKRTPCPLSALNIGLKCGGSDGLSGITANPVLGLVSDFLIYEGGSAVLTEVPEMFGAEHLLMARAASREVFQDTVSLIVDFKAYFTSHNQPIYENPSPGNKAGGISTLEEKSLGCTQKSGTSQVVDVLGYGERLRKKGLTLLSAPGNDLVASTALAAAGCQIVLFTTGRGTPFGTFVPTMKISSNTPLAQKKPKWMDFNAGEIVAGRAMEDVAADLMESILDVASGKLCAAERAGFHDIAIFKRGVTL